MSPIPNKPEGNDALSEDDVVMLLSARHAKILEPLRAIGRVPAYVTIPSDLDNGASALLKALFSLIRELRKRPRAAVFTDTADRLGMLAWLAALLMRRKLIYRSRGDVVRENMLTRSWGRYLFNRYLFFRRLSGLIPCSDYLGEVARLDFPGLAPSRIRTVNLPRPQGKTAEKLLPAEERKRWIIIASKFHFIDKIQPLQSILPQIHAFITQNPEFRCVVLGDGQHLDVIKDQCASLNMHDMVDFLGYVPNPEEYFARGLCLLHISDLDGYPSVIDEARLNNLPVICNDALGLPEMIDHGVDGFLLKPGYDDLGSVLNRLKDPEEFTRIAKTALERVNRLNAPEAIGQQFASAIKAFIRDEPQTDEPAVEPRRLRVLFVIKDFNRVGGAQRHLSQITRYMDKPIKSYVICMMEENRRIFQSVPYAYQVEMGFSTGGYTPLELWRMGRRLRDFIVGHRIDLVYSYGFEAGLLGGIGSMLARIPHISRRGEMAHWRKFHHWLAFGLINLLSERILVNSSMVMSATHRELFSRHKTELVHNGIKFPIADPPALERPMFDADTPVVGIVANLRPVKNLTMFIDAAHKVVQERPDTRFCIVGEGPDYQRLREYIHSLDLSEHVHLLGYRADVNSLLKQWKCFVLTSITEGSSHAILEAMAAELPVVATAVGGNLDMVVDGQTGFLIKLGDVDKLATSIGYLLADPEKARDMGLAGSERIRGHFSINAAKSTQGRIIKDVVCRFRARYASEIEWSGFLPDPEEDLPGEKQPVAQPALDADTVTARDNSAVTAPVVEATTDKGAAQ